MAKNTTKKSKLAVFALVVLLLGTLIATTIRSIISSLNLGLDLRGGFEILYQVEPLNEGATVDMSAVINSISKRINVLGVSEPQITVEGNNRVRVQIAGAKDLETARELIGTTANLTFRDVDNNELADSSILQEGGASLAYKDGEPIVSLKIADKEKFAAMTKAIGKMAIHMLRKLRRQRRVKSLSISQLLLYNQKLMATALSLETLQRIPLEL